MKLYYSPDYTSAAHAFDTTRKATWIADSLAASPIAGVSLAEPEPLTEQALAQVHSREYIDAVKTGVPRHLAESSGFPWDAAVWHAVRASNGGAVAAALHAYRSGENAGSLSSGLHHAHRGSGGGFCTFNGLALAARALLDTGAMRILILDLDAHFGDGTVAIVRAWPGVVHADISIGGWGADDAPHLLSDSIAAAEDYLPTLARRMDELEHHQFDVCLYNAGMDPYEGCSIGGLHGMSAEHLRLREAMVFAWAARAGVPVAFVMAGGYVSRGLPRETLVALHRLTIEAAAARDHRS